jgi:hypothetical protein
VTSPRPRIALLPAAPFGLRRWLLTGSRSRWWYLRRDWSVPEEDLWRASADAVVEHYATRHPGRRPAPWWRYSAPAPRARLGGTGTPLHEIGSHPWFEFGVPVSSQWRRRGDFLTRGVPVDPADPPTYESEAAYLLRLDLLLPGEQRRLTAPDYRPVYVRVIDDDRIGLFHQ